MLLTFGLSILAVNATSIVLTPQAKDANLDWRFDVFDLGFASVTFARLAVFIVCIALVLGSYVLLMRTRLGKQMRRRVPQYGESIRIVLVPGRQDLNRLTVLER